MAKLTRDQRLTRGGVVFFDVDGVLARTTKTAKLTPEQIVASTDIAGMGAIVAGFVRKRVRDERTTAQGPFKGYSTRWSVFISPDYAESIGSGRRWWRTKAWQMRDVGTGLFAVSGGMWAGLQARSGDRGRSVTIDFRDMSIAQHAVKAGKRRIKRGKNAGKEVRRRGNIRVKNSQKAGVILSKLGVNVTQPTFNENLAMADAVSNKIGLKMAAVMDADSVQLRATTGARTTLVRDLKRYWEV